MREDKISTSFVSRILRPEEASLFLGKERLERLAKGWLDSVTNKRTAFMNLLENKCSPAQPGEERRYSTGFDLSKRRLRNIFESAGDKQLALQNFYNGQLFCFLCGWTLFLSLDYSDAGILRILIHDTRETGNFSSWLAGIPDRNWVRKKVFNVECKDRNNFVPRGEIGELICLIALRSDDISKFLSHNEISGALNSIHSVVYEALRIKHVKVERIRNTLEKYLEFQTLKESMVLLLKDTYLLEFKTFLVNIELAWWFAEVFSKKEFLCILTDEATRVTDFVYTYPTKVKWAWGEEFLPRVEDVIKFRGTMSPYKGQTVFDIDGHEWESILCAEIQTRGIEGHADFIKSLREVVLRNQFGWKILSRMETLAETKRHKGMNDNSCFHEDTNPLVNILERVFAYDESGASSVPGFDLQLTPSESFQEEALWEWLPFIIRYSGNVDHVKMILTLLSVRTRRLNQNNFQPAARSFLLAHSNVSSDVCQLVRLFIGGLQRDPDSLINILLAAGELELRTFILQNSPETFATVKYVSVWSVLISLMLKKKSIWELDEDTVGNIFIGLIQTTRPSEFLGVLKMFHNLFSPCLLKGALLSNKVLYFLAVPPRDLDIYVYYQPKDSRTVYNKVLAFRLYFFVFKEDLSWTTHCVDYDFCLMETVPLEILSVLENTEATQIFPIQPKETRIAVVSQFEKRLRKQLFKGSKVTLCKLTKRFSYGTEAEWIRLLQALDLSKGSAGNDIATCVPIQGYGRRVDSIVALLRVWVNLFGVEETRRAGDEEDLWSWGKLYDDDLNGLGFLQAAVEAESLKGVKILAWPGLMRLRNKRGKSIGEVAMEIWGGDHEITKYLEKRLEASRIFQDET